MRDGSDTALTDRPPAQWLMTPIIGNILVIVV